jgi:hypothetical protein
LGRGDLDANGLPFTDASQGKDAFAVVPVLGMDTTAEPAVRLDAQMIAGAIPAAFGAGRTTCLDATARQLPHHFEFFDVKAHG